MDIYHPTLEGLDIRAVAVTKLGAPEQTGDGEWTISIEVLEFRHPKLTLAKPEGPASPTPVDPVDQWIDDLAGQATRLVSE